MDLLIAPVPLHTACHELDLALRAELCITSLRMRIHRGDRDVEYGSGPGPAGGAMVRMLIRDDRGIVGDIQIVDGCHRSCTGAAVREMARIVEAYAEGIRQALVQRDAAALAV